jgi:ubiquinone/menaquinone biosynthesis C-methylase UbiE
MHRDITRRTTFDTIADLYRTVRPGYPEELFDALISATRIRPDSNLLEIGPGTGQATKSLAKRGFKIRAIELGSNLAEIARHELREYPNVTVVNGSFETVELDPGSFDLIYVATAFHWIEPEFKLTKPSKLLRGGGHLAVITSQHVSDESGDEFFLASRPIYEKYREEEEDDYQLPNILDLKPQEVDGKLFRTVFFGVFPVAVRYTAEEFVQLTSTFSETIAMEDSKRKEMLADIYELIKNKFNGEISYQYAMALTVAKKK